MVRKKFTCSNCGHDFEMDVFEKGEGREKRFPSGPIRCPKCGGPDEKRSI
ncbi:cytochrome C551 [Candidatus Omnitrophota bacterium]